mgnify:CR=1 FL=1
MLVVVTATVMAQPPANYYNTATGTGYTLKTQLFNIIKNHNDPGYSALYTTYLTSDRDFFFENDGTVLDIYSERPTATDPYNYSATNSNDRCGNYDEEGDCYNREHIIPQSVFDSQTPMYSDAHFVVPSDGFVNGARGSLPFGRVANANYTSQNGSKRGPNLNSGYSAGYTGLVFEPIDEFKGDIARMYFYFATRYQNQISGWDYEMFNGTSNQVFTNHSINVLLTWHIQDPVSPREITRNNAIYNQQNNRNPFIDNPQYALDIWGSLLSNNEFEAAEAIAVAPNPSADGSATITSAVSIDSVEVYTVNGQLAQTFKSVNNGTEISLKGLPQGFYFLKINSGFRSISKKWVVR